MWHSFNSQRPTRKFWRNFNSNFGKNMYSNLQETTQIIVGGSKFCLSQNLESRTKYSHITTFVHGMSCLRNLGARWGLGGSKSQHRRVRKLSPTPEFDPRSFRLIATFNLLLTKTKPSCSHLHWKEIASTWHTILLEDLFVLLIAI
jgi:hypothetical protein